MKNIIYLSIFLLSICQSLAQEFNKLEIKIDVESKDLSRTLTANVQAGSGDYTYVWVCSAPYGIYSDRSLQQAAIPLDTEDIEYQVFVRDNNSGRLGYASINFSPSPQVGDLIVFPNPAKDVLEVTLGGTGASDNEASESIGKIELFSEKSTNAKKTLDVPDSNTKRVSLDVKDVEPGVYYLHVQLSDDDTKSIRRKIVRVLVGD